MRGGGKNSSNRREEALAKKLQVKQKMKFSLGAADVLTSAAVEPLVLVS